MSILELSRIAETLDECLDKVEQFKSLSLHLGDYESCARIREIQNRIHAIVDLISDLGISIPNVVIPASANNLYHGAFLHAIAVNWRSLPLITQKLLSERKTRLNNEIQFDDQDSTYLLKLNQTLEDHENRIIDFYRSFRSVLSSKDMKDFCENEQVNSFTIKCYSSPAKTDQAKGVPDDDDAFYKLIWPAKDLIAMRRETQEEYLGLPNFLMTLPIGLAEEQFCGLFIILAQNGLLAWSDMLNIDRIKIELNLCWYF